MKTDIPGRGTGRCRIPPGGVGEFGHIFLRLKDIFTESEAIDAVGDETHGGHASLGTVESALEGRVRSGGAGGGEEASAESQRGARRAERLGRAQCDVRLRGRQKGRRRSRAARESVKSTVAEGVALLGGTNQSRDRGGGPIAVRIKDEAA